VLKLVGEIEVDTLIISVALYNFSITANNNHIFNRCINGHQENIGNYTYKPNNINFHRNIVS
jgi:hypothetical protein